MRQTWRWPLRRSMVATGAMCCALIASVVSGCNSNDTEADDTVTVYTVERDTTYVGDILGTTGQRTLGEFAELRFTGARGAPGSGDVILFRQGVADEGHHRDLVIVRNGGGAITDGLLLTGDTTGVWLGVACAGSNPVVLASGQGEALRAWQVGNDWLLHEADLSGVTDAEVADACVTNGFNVLPGMSLK